LLNSSNEMRSGKKGRKGGKEFVVSHRGVKGKGARKKEAFEIPREGGKKGQNGKSGIVIPAQKACTLRNWGLQREFPSSRPAGLDSSARRFRKKKVTWGGKRFKDRSKGPKKDLEWEKLERGARKGPATRKETRGRVAEAEAGQTLEDPRAGKRKKKGKCKISTVERGKKGDTGVPIVGHSGIE